jgi:hypothetical protein
MDLSSLKPQVRQHVPSPSLVHDRSARRLAGRRARAPRPRDRWGDPFGVRRTAGSMSESESAAASTSDLPTTTASHGRRRQVIWAPRRPAVSAATAHGWNRPEGGSSTQVLDSVGNLGTRLSAPPRNLVEVLHPECAFGAQPTSASALQPAPQRHGAVTRVACRASVEWSPDRPAQQP